MKTNQTYRAIYLALVTTLLPLCLPLQAEVWGIKSADPVTAPYSGPPVTLFHFSEDGSSFVTNAPITLGGSQVDVDGLAIDRTGTLYAFVRSGSDSQLVALNKTNSVATPIGPILTGYSIRGAVFTLTGHLLVLDVTDKLLEINPATGLIVGSPLTLTLNGQPINWDSMVDIAQSPSGDLIVALDNQFYKLDPVSGALSLYILTTPMALMVSTSVSWA